MMPYLAPAIAVFAGCATGWIYFRLLGQGIAHLLTPGQRRRGLALHGLRFVLMGALLFGAVQAGALALLGAFAGVLLARHLVLRHERRQMPC